MGQQDETSLEKPKLTVEDQAIESQLKIADGNRAELQKALDDAPEEHRQAIRFLVGNMVPQDLRSVSAEFLLEDVRLAYEAREASPWKDQVSESLFFNNVLPFANVSEKREKWRAKLREICLPIIKDCSTTEEAALAINKQLFKTIKVKYSTKRKRADQSPSESMEQGRASCTGLTILYVDACRSVNVPARLVGIPSWTTKRGNHTWAEVWANNDWHFAGAAEPDPKGLDRGWFVKDASMADASKRMNSIYAVSFARSETTFPMVWARGWRNSIHAINVTERYTRDQSKETPRQTDLVTARIRVWNLGKSSRIATPIEIRQPEEQTVLGQGRSTGNEADMNDLFEVNLAPNGTYEAILGTGDDQQTLQFKTNAEATQLIEIELTQ